MPDRPSSNGQVERYNRVLLQLILCYIFGDQNTWDEYLQQLAGILANMMMFGREVSQPFDLMMGTSINHPYYENAGKYVQDLRQNLERIHAVVRQNLQLSQARQKQVYDL